MKSVIVLIVFCVCVSAKAQHKIVTLDEAIAQALQQNKSIQVATLDVDYQQRLKRTSGDIGKTNIVYMTGQYNSYVHDNNITITQSIPFPSVFTSQLALGKSQVKGSELKKAASENELTYQVKQVYSQLQYFSAKERLLRKEDSIFQNFVKASDLRYRTGESKLLEKTTAETQRDEVRNLLAQTQSDVLIYQSLLQTLMNSSEPVTTSDIELHARTFDLSIDSAAIAKNPQLAYLRQQVSVADDEHRVARAKVLPDITVGYFNQTLAGTPVNSSGDLATSGNRFQGFQIGLSVPIWFHPQSAKVKAAAVNQQKLQAQYDYHESVMQGEWQSAVQRYIKDKSNIQYYETSALKNAALILRQSDLAFRNGEIGYTEYWLSVRSGIQIEENYLRAVNDFNQSIISLEFLAGSK